MLRKAFWAVCVYICLNPAAAMLRSLTRIQRDAGVLANAPFVGICHGPLLFSRNITPSALGGDETVMGMIGTSVTKKLWQERLTKNKDRLKHLPLPALNAKPPQPITVTYPFSSDRFLQEQVRAHTDHDSVSPACWRSKKTPFCSIEILGIKCVLASCLRISTLWLVT